LTPGRSSPCQRFFLAAAVVLGAALMLSSLPAGVLFESPERIRLRSSEAAGQDLPSILDRAAEYCDKLSRSALNFVCRERIDEWFYLADGPIDRWAGRNFLDRRRATTAYVYDYQLIRDRGGEIRETRTLLKENGKDVRIPDASLKVHVFDYAYVVMGPLGLLSRSNQTVHEYRIVGEEKIEGEPAVVLEAVPKPGIIVDHLFGRIWVRRKDAGILKIQWNPASVGNYAKVEEIGRRFKMTPALLLNSEYAFEHNGIRFPSRYSVKEIYARKNGARYQRSETEVIYDRYKFFTVETEVIYRGSNR